MSDEKLSVAKAHDLSLEISLADLRDVKRGIEQYFSSPHRRPIAGQSFDLERLDRGGHRGIKAVIERRFPFIDTELGGVKLPSMRIKGRTIKSTLIPRHNKIEIRLDF